jgi:hypothetical protein
MIYVFLFLSLFLSLFFVGIEQRNKTKIILFFCRLRYEYRRCVYYFNQFQRLSTFSLTFSLLYSQFASRPGSAIFFAAAFPPACTLSAASFASSSMLDIGEMYYALY